MKGVEYFFDEEGEPKAVLIDLRKNKEIWEDFQDIMIARKRRNEPSVPAKKVHAKLKNAKTVKQ